MYGTHVLDEVSFILFFFSILLSTLYQLEYIQAETWLSER